MRPIFASTLVAAALVVTACGGSGKSGSSASGIPAGPIKIGALLTLNGPFASIGTPQEVNDEALVSLLNKNGGIAGHQVELITINDRGDPTAAVLAAQQLVSDHVVGVIYAGTSATVTNTVPVFMKNKVPVVMIDPLDQWDNGAKWPYLFDNYPLNQATTDVMASFAVSTLNASKLGVIDDGSTFADVLISDLRNSVARNGVVQIARTVSYQPTAADVTTQLRQLQSSGANAIVLLATAGMANVYNGLRTIRWTPPIITTAASFFNGFSSLGNLGPTTYSNCAVALQKGQEPDPSITAVLQATSAKTGVNPSVGQLVLTNDDLLILKAAIQQTNSVSPEKIKSAIEGFSDNWFTSPSITYSFSAGHHGGWPESQIYMCNMTPLGPFDLPYIAP